MSVSCFKIKDFGSVLTGVTHRVVCCVGCGWCKSEREESTVRALAPLEIFVALRRNVTRANNVGTRGRNT